MVLVKFNLKRLKEYPDGYIFEIQSSIRLKWSFTFMRFADEYERIDGFIESALDLITNDLTEDYNLEEFWDAAFLSFAFVIETEVFTLSKATFRS